MDHADLVKFVPATREEMLARGWNEIDILIVSGDAYIDHPAFGPPLIARILLDAGYRVGFIPQPDWKNPDSLKIFGRPLLGCGISSGNMDSMVKLYTAGRRLRHEDMFSENGKTGMCPPHASVVYSQLAKRAFPGITVVLGGVEASLRRFAHYDYWQDKMRPSILVDSKADILCYGMGEITMPEIFFRIKSGKHLGGIRGTCRYLGGKESTAYKIDDTCLELPSYEEFISDKTAIMWQTKIVERESNPWNARKLLQWTNGRLIVAEPPREPMTSEQFDKVSELPFAMRPHPTYKGRIGAWEMIKDSVTVVRGCPGGCAFCGLVCHQGRQIVSRTPQSVLRSVEKLTKEPFFKGTISDLGGAAGNIYLHRPKDQNICRKCRRYSCIFPSLCPNYNADEKPLIDLLNKVAALPKVKHVFINSGIRLDLALLQRRQTEKIIMENTGGQISVAPEHMDADVLRLMRKGKPEEFDKFKEIFEQANKKAGKRQFMVPYFISNFPGCTESQAKKVHDYLEKNHLKVQQMQDYIPIPMTMGCAMYCSETAPDGTPIKVNKGLAQRRTQRNMLRKR